MACSPAAFAVFGSAVLQCLLVKVGARNPGFSTPIWPGGTTHTDNEEFERFKDIFDRTSSSINAAIVYAVVMGFLMKVVPILAVCAGIMYFCCRWQKSHKQLGSEEEHDGLLQSDLERGGQGPLVFTYEELKIATKNFSHENMLGKGGFGTVYKATLNDGSSAAVKKLIFETDEGKEEFLNEINIVKSIQHRNLVRLKGYCIKGTHRLVVYELMENGSLHHALFDENCGIFLDWQARFNIALGVARGLAYLHEDSQVHIIHRDIKASNILLDENLNPKISDFGISKFFNLAKGYTSTKIAGTFGYLAPEYALYGLLTSKADVYSFGVLLLEVISGRKCNDPGQQLLLPWIWKAKEAGELHEVVDEKVRTNADQTLEDKFDRIIHIGLVCTRENEDTRPIMSDVVAMLQGYLEIPPVQRVMPAYVAHIDNNEISDRGGSEQDPNVEEAKTVLAFELEPQTIQQAAPTLISRKALF